MEQFRNSPVVSPLDPIRPRSGLPHQNPFFGDSRSSLVKPHGGYSEDHDMEKAMFILKNIMMIFALLFLSIVASALSAEEAKREAIKVSYETSKMKDEVLQALLNYQAKVENREDWIQVYLPNNRGQLVPQYVKAYFWNQRPKGCTGDLVTPTPENLVNPCRRMIQTHPDFKRADELQWAKRPDGSLEMQSCPQGTLESCAWPLPPPPQAPCDHKDHLPPETSYENLMLPGMDCLGQQARNNDLIAMACNMYFESRGEGQLGKRLVGEITANRTRANIQKNRTPNTIRGTVYEMRGTTAQFSWVTDSPKKVEFPTTGPSPDRNAWYEALYQAALLMDHKNDKFASIGMPQLPCYTHYLSLNRYQNFDQVPEWAKQYYRDAQNKPSNKRPVCLGAHIFFRAPDYEYGCSPGDQLSDAEGEDQEIPIRSAFYEGCLGLPDQLEPEAPVTIPPNSMCNGNSIKDALCAQTHETTTWGVSGKPRLCTDGISVEVDPPAER